MKSFRIFLKEEAEEGSKLKHITHPEDRPLMHGYEGFEHAHKALMQAHEHMKAGHKSTNLTMKYDGSPSIVFGHHPKNGKFFVATKSAFNKNPKINHTEADIDKNHGHAPGLASKLKTALKHLPKVTPKKGVFQGDLMHTQEDLRESKVSFTPNTITYTAHGKEADRIKKSKIGVAVHQEYHGSDIDNMKVSPHPDLSKFKEHSDVHLHGAEHDTGKIKYSASDESAFQKHMAAAKQIHDTHGDKMYSTIHPKHSGDSGHFATYINKTVRHDEVPNVKGFKEHLKAEHEKQASKVTTEKSKETKRAEGASQIAHVEKNKSHYANLLSQHHHLAQAKNALVRSLESHEGRYTHHIGNKKSKPEGFVINTKLDGDKEEPSKLVNRSEFAKANLLKTHKKVPE
jgi:cation transport regulator ChaC